MAVLTASGITFSDTSQLNSKYGIFPQTTPLTFYQTPAPTGWAQVTTHNDKALRIVSGTGAGSGGTNALSSTFPTAKATEAANVAVTINGLSVAATTIDINTMAQHSHPANGGPATGRGTPSPAAGTRPTTANGPGLTGNNGGSGSHTHPISFTSASGPLSTTVNFGVQYIDIIYCTFS